jgi:hypothetical protein
MSKLAGIDYNEGILYLDPFNPVQIPVTAADRTKLILSLIYHHLFPEYKIGDEDERYDKIRREYEKKWRKDKNLLLNKEEEEAFGLCYLCTAAGLHFYGRWVSTVNLNIRTIGSINANSNIFFSSSGGQTREDLIKVIQDLLKGIKQD